MSFAGGGLIFLWTASASATATVATATEPDGYIGAGGLGVWAEKPAWTPRPVRWRRWRNAA